MLHSRTWSGFHLDVSIKLSSLYDSMTFVELLTLCCTGGPGIMVVVDTTSITQVIEWGKLATFVGFDTRLSYRSKEPTLGSCKSSQNAPAVTTV